MNKFKIASPAKKIAEEEEGGITVLSLFLLVGMLMVAGFAVDINNMTRSHTQLQGAADAAGHAALVRGWQTKSAATAKTDAIAIAAANVPSSTDFSDIIRTTDIEFGDWDSATRKFTPDPGDMTAVRVTARRDTTRGNAIRTFLMKFVGHNRLNIEAVSVWDYDEGWCPKGEGFFAVGRVDIQSGNNYQDGFCIHSDDHVEFNQGSTFQEGVVVSMPDEDELVVPNSGMDQNAGLEDALESISYNLSSFFNDLPDLANEYKDPLSYVQGSYLTNVSQTYTKTIKKSVTATDIVPNAVNILTCPNNGTLTIDSNVVIKDAVIFTTCDVKFNAGAAIENGTLVTTSTSSKSVSAPAGFRVGAKTFCNDGQGGANVITLGDFSVAASMEAYGANVIAGGNMSVTANAGGLAGINFMAGGELNATSNGDMGFCNYGPPTPFAIPVFRLVM